MRTRKLELIAKSIPRLNYPDNLEMLKPQVIFGDLMLIPAMYILILLRFLLILITVFQ